MDARGNLGRACAVLMCLVASLAVAGTPAGAASQSDNVRLLENFDVGYGNEIAFDGSRVYVGFLICYQRLETVGGLPSLAT